MPRTFQAPKGTRDAYPDDYLRRRYIVESWRRVALRHGFDEIDGPTFEHAELYTVKSGQGILNEMFGVFSGKDEAQREAAGVGPVSDRSGEAPRTISAPFALRPEFTPTLARMYAARAAQLPKPCKWFCVPNFFRAERPQRGRLREFLQWNVDVIGGSSPEDEAEVVVLLIELLRSHGLSPQRVQVNGNVAGATEEMLSACGVTEPERQRALVARIDSLRKMPESTWIATARKEGMPEEVILLFTDPAAAERAHAKGASPRGFAPVEATQQRLDTMMSLVGQSVGMTWLVYDPAIVRGLAYYTGTVFEVIAEGERAVAGGGRYDNLIELFGGPPTPACGFGMGDVVLTNLLEDHGLMPKGKDLLTALDEPVRTRPDVFVVPGPGLDDETAQRLITGTLATLRRGRLGDGEREPWHPARYDVRPLHARRSYKSTRNVGKLLKEADGVHARFAVIIEDDRTASVKDLETQEQEAGVGLDDVGGAVWAKLNAR